MPVANNKNQYDPLKISGNHRIQTMPCNNIGAGLTSLSGAITGFSLVECVEDGVFVVTSSDGSDGTYTRIAGSIKSLNEGDAVTITSGTFDFA